MNRVPSRTLLRTLAATASLALALAVAGCGSDDDSSKPEAKSEALSVSDAKAALLTQEEVGDGFAPDTSDDDDDDSDAPGCLEEMDEATTDAPVEEDVDYASTSELGAPLVSHQVASYDNDADAEKAMTAARDAVEKCTSVDDTDEDGARFELEIESDDDESFEDGDEQLNIVATGSITQGTESLPVIVTFSAVRIGNSVTVLSVTDIAETPTAGIEDLLNTVAERLVAVDAGEDPDA